jgi:hypothetical protein
MRWLVREDKAEKAEKKGKERKCGVALLSGGG